MLPVGLDCDEEVWFSHGFSVVGMSEDTPCY